MKLKPTTTAFLFVLSTECLFHWFFVFMLLIKELFIVLIEYFQGKKGSLAYDVYNNDKGNCGITN